MVVTQWYSIRVVGVVGTPNAGSVEIPTIPPNIDEILFYHGSPKVPGTLLTFFFFFVFFVEYLTHLPRNTSEFFFLQKYIRFRYSRVNGRYSFIYSSMLNNFRKRLKSFKIPKYVLFHITFF